jgi:hypothetical protein
MEALLLCPQHYTRNTTEWTLRYLLCCKQAAKYLSYPAKKMDRENARLLFGYPSVILAELALRRDHVLSHRTFAGSVFGFLQLTLQLHDLFVSLCQQIMQIDLLLLPMHPRS